MATIFLLPEAILSVLRNPHSEQLQIKHLMNGKNMLFKVQREKGFLRRSIVLPSIAPFQGL
ncbi:hypothetical protein AYK25_07230 [Thermoplasmatales archaeon SM1-50]|nr:MAG: hypothetical protein AYK25_07230 [Thermoplasmatales archaeon SM1-50]